ncbi:NUMOD4 motif-containing HNH endonuclease [Loigolactobacillus backii]|uniref:NUMOD4 motif-containing HNH endonuclease n=1 Tax=Loigolactobacillus backii TaxID=375175 RepID=UPI0022FD902D|nr:NUMOD4 motif-containing HNH endonuclease [Loigolactobacillus backii]MDA5386973.1 NUMOD4 motif-containing HNH endonuclease [Loigolactobacillus backii]MDA5389511.1 NUMOD4 motif-containing HNH endonuclease [Loigolactobacillus backii]
MEKWKDIPGYEGRYQASDLGRIRSLDRVQQTKKGSRHYKGKLLRPGRYSKAGHVSVVLGHGENGKPVHRLVTLAFLGPRPEGADICHNNGDPTDNRLVNLRYDSRTENILDVYRQGRAWRKLSKADVIKIKHLLPTQSGVEIAKRFGVTPTIVSAIKHNRIFWWVGDAE